MQQGILNTYNNIEEAEKMRLRQAVQSTYTERFYTLMRLIKVSSMIRNATIISAPFLPDEK